MTRAPRRLALLGITLSAACFGAHAYAAQTMTDTHSYAQQYDRYAGHDEQPRCRRDVRIHP